MVWPRAGCGLRSRSPGRWRIALGLALFSLPKAVESYCRFTTLSSCSGTEHHLQPYSAPTGLVTAFTPIDIRVPAPPLARTPGAFFISYQVADLDGDTWPDLLVMMSTRLANGTSRVIWLRNKGAAPPGTPPHLRIVPSYQWSGSVLDLASTTAMAMAAGDLNGDGVVDLVVGLQHELRFYWGKQVAGSRVVFSNTTFESVPWELGPGPAPDATSRVPTKWPMIQVADLDGDGLPDLVLRRSSAENWVEFDDMQCDIPLQFFKNTGNASQPSFNGSSPGTEGPLSGITACQSFFLYDLDQDGDLDLGFLRTSFRLHHFEWFWTYLENVGSPAHAHFQQAGHLNPLKPLYLLSAYDQVHWGHRQVLWAPQRTGESLHHLLRPNFDVVYSVEVSFTKNGVRSVNQTVPYMPSENHRDPFDGINCSVVGEQLLFVDVDGDGPLDVVGAGSAYLHNKGTIYSPNFEAVNVSQASEFVRKLSGMFVDHWAVAMEDMTGDGLPDLLAVDQANQLHIWPASKPNNGSGSNGSWPFTEPPLSFDLSKAVCLAPVHGDCFIKPHLVVGDLDGDGANDLVLTSCRFRCATGLKVWRNMGTGSKPQFVGGGSELYDLPWYHLVVALVDVDTNGKTEIVMAGNIMPYMTVRSVVFDEDGTAHFFDQNDTPDPFTDLFLPTSSPSGLYSADLDADGIVDVIIDSGHGLLSTFQGGKCGFSSSSCSSNGACLSSAMSYGTCLCSDAYNGTHCEICAKGYVMELMERGSAGKQSSCVSCRSKGWGQHSTTDDKGACVCMETFGVNATDMSLEGLNTSECRCPPGTHFRPPHLCQECPLNSYTDTYHLEAGCSACPTADYLTLSTGSSRRSDCVCPSGFYDVNGTGCHACGGALQCDKPGSVVEQVRLKPGYWRANRRSLLFKECPENAGCLGGQDPDKQCDRGTGGPLCMVCQPGYSRSWTGPCAQCRSLKVLVLVPLVLLLLVGLAVYWWAHLSRLAGSEVERKVKIVITLFQIIGTFNETFDSIKASELLGKVANSPVFKLLQIDFSGLFALSCINPRVNYFHGLIIYTLLPPLAIGCVAGGALVYEWHVRRVAILTPRRKQMLIRGIFTVTNLVYMGVAEKVLGAFQPCDDVQDGQAFFPLDYRIRCHSPTHIAMLAYAVIAALAYPVGIPCVYFYLLYTNREAIKNRPDEEDDEEEDDEAVASHWSSRQHLDSSIAYMASIFDAYKNKFWFYELVDVGARVMYTLLDNTLADNKPTLLLWVILVSLVSGICLYNFKPYKETPEQRLAQMAFWQLHLTFLSMFVRYSYPTMGVGGKRVLNVGLLLLNSSTLVLAIVQLGTHWHEILSKVKGDLPSVQGWRWGKEGQHGGRLTDFESKEEGKDVDTERSKAFFLRRRLEGLRASWRRSTRRAQTQSTQESEGLTGFFSPSPSVSQLHGGGVEMVTPPRPARSPSAREFKTPEGPDN